VSAVALHAKVAWERQRDNACGCVKWMLAGSDHFSVAARPHPQA